MEPVVPQPQREQREPALSAGALVKNRWTVSEKLGQGAFGETYAGKDQDGTEVAIKVELWDNRKMVLKLEVMALKKLQACPYIVKYISSGRQEEFNFLVMERLGENLAELRKRVPSGKFSMGTTVRLGIHMLNAIEGCHQLQYTHRDIKPSNFVIGLNDKCRQAFLIDFGLARKYRLANGDIRPARRQAGFRGTARYASINSHQSRELSRRDDLWSLFYVLVEFATGALPWRRLKDKDEIGKQKEKCTNADLCSAIEDGGEEFKKFMDHLNNLSFAADPDYDYLKGLLEGIRKRVGEEWDHPMDWERKGQQPPPPLHNQATGNRDRAGHGRHTSPPRPKPSPPPVERAEQSSEGYAEAQPENVSDEEKGEEGEGGAQSREASPSPHPPHPRDGNNKPQSAGNGTIPKANSKLREAPFSDALQPAPDAQGHGHPHGHPAPRPQNQTPPHGHHPQPNTVPVTPIQPQVQPQVQQPTNPPGRSKSCKGCSIM